MANRFPLILNSNSNQIQELAANDTLDLTGSGLNLTGITTLSTGAQLNLGGGTNINAGSRGDILYYGSSGTVQKLSLGATGKILKSNGTDLVYGDSGSIANVYYVSPSGTDASGFGGSVDRPFKTIKYASANIGTPTSVNPAILFIKAGTYEEAQLPIVVPPHTTIAGDSLRATIIKPAAGNDSSGSVLNNRSTMFRMSDATVLQDLVMDGMGGYVPGSPNFKPESATIGGVYLGFNSVSPILGKSPYIYNCTSFGNGATGALLDGALHASGNRSMLFHTYTAVHSDGLGIFLKGNANAEMISTFTYYCTVGFACIGGSKIRSLNSSNAYGEYAVYSAGFDAGETANTGTIKGTMLTYTNVLTTSFTNGEQITGGTSGATAYVINVQSEPKVMYIVQKSGTFQASETVTGGSSGATATLAAGGSFETNQSGRILVTTFSTSPDAGDSLQFASTDGNAFQIQSVSSVTANSVAYHVLVFSTSRATPVAANVQVIVRKEFSLVRLTGHDFLQVGTGGTDTTNWPNNPSQNPSQADQVVTNSTDPGRVYYTATDELGNFYVGDQFKVDQATGNVTLDASAFNLSGLESLRLGSVGGLIGAAVGEFSTDGTLSQNSDTKVPTQKAVKTYVDNIDSASGNFTIAGISTVTGTTHFTKQLNVAGVSTFHGNINLLDGDRARFGSSEDLQIYHDSNNSYIAENGAGNLLIQASAGSIILQKAGGEEMIKANVDGAVELYQDDVLRLTTTSTGVSIGGTLTVSGNVSIGGTLTYEDVTNIDSVGIVTARQGVRVPDGSNSANYISIGTGNDTKLYHSGNHSYIKHTGTGNFYVDVNTGDTFAVTGEESETIIQGTHNGSVDLFHNGSKKFETTNTGAVISGICTATTFSGSGASLTNLNGSAIASGTVPVARIGTGTKDSTTFYRGDGTFQVVSTDLVGDSSPQLGGDLQSNGSDIVFADSDKAIFGASSDLIIKHDSANWIESMGTNTLNFTVNNGSEYAAQMFATGRVELRYDNTKRIETTNTGVDISGSYCVFSGAMGSTENIKIANTTSGGYIQIGLQQQDSDGLHHRAYIRAQKGGASIAGKLELLARGSGGGADRGFTIDAANNIQSSLTIIPSVNNSYDLGSSSYRWANIYTNDLNLSNEGGKNEVDGTWGNYTIQEGESDLFLINKRNGKKYKFNLTEVS